MRVELFVRDLELSTWFYVAVLRFTLESDADSDYRELVGHDSKISLHPISNLGAGHPLNQPGPLGLGLELVLEVSDVGEFYEHVRARWPIEAEPQKRPWGLVDFRLLDSEGYYWRVTEPSSP